MWGAKPKRIHADPDPGQNFTSEKGEFLNENMLQVGNLYVVKYN
jgi:hypothetical protein